MDIFEIVIHFCPTKQIRCGSADHKVADCSEAKRCYTCNEEGHESWDCPQKA